MKGAGRQQRANPRTSSLRSAVCQPLGNGADVVVCKGLGGIGMAPQAPCPPDLILPARWLSASLRLAYLAAISRKPGPTSLVSRPWQAMQPAFCASAWAAAPVLLAAAGVGLAAVVALLTLAGEGLLVSAPRWGPTRRCCSARLPLLPRAKSGRKEATWTSAVQSFMQATACTSGLPTLPVRLPGHSAWSVVMPWRLGSSFCASAMVVSDST